METNFDRAFEFAMKWEQYKSDDPNDPGRLTIWGVSSTYHRAEVEKMISMTKDEARTFAKSFYHTDYWLKAGCDKIVSPLDLVVFDTAIIPGPTVAAGLLGVTHNLLGRTKLTLQS
jgi:lysozyme family protein